MSERTIAVQPKAPSSAFNASRNALMQRQCTCGIHIVGGGECATCSKIKSGMQRKLTIGSSNDPLELEADRVADKVMAAPSHANISVAPLRIQRYAGPAAGDAGTAPASVDRALANPGRPLEPALQQDMGRRFGHDFSQVRVHSSTDAEQSTRDVNAKAYTVGNNIVFGAGQFVPGTQEGRRLIAHELTHVVQQSANPALLQRAENDTVPGCAVLTDTQSDVDTKVNATLASARATARVPPAGLSVAQGVVTALATNTQPGRSAIEVWASTLPTAKASQPAQSATKYAGVTYRLWSQTSFPILNPTMKINGICVGSDKLGHFFQQGMTYLTTQASSGRAAAEEESERSEGGGYGLFSTGVFSNADQEANRQGGRFYSELIATPTMSFSIARYISSRWSEVENPNFYEESVGHQVWANTLSGYWTGQSLDTSVAPAKSFNEVWMGELNATTTGAVTGRFSVGGRNLGNIRNGVIGYNTTTVKGENPVLGNTSLSPISGIHISFDWTLDSNSGKGFLDSRGERNLVGRWGRGTSDTDRGAWDIRRS
ncbi:eCIS core domain-containing protein [Sulfurirhabdus autotrophica]|uniref:Uncharacterized protein DUF4157 n=1 Tax=Sulfurirhabdus autotrophica TaxID=1706046 RepID=A0A4R3Y852_9PROT|nr:DUF4157 domain-containing protein [Sulfurirhabdus autotrophica]TCV86754.1 uncharacterized protein DUF4157 [Sulfurirhabdus autotrophica]